MSYSHESYRHFFLKHHDNLRPHEKYGKLSSPGNAKNTLRFFSFKNCATLHAEVYTPMIKRTSYQLQYQHTRAKEIIRYVKLTLL